MDVKPLPPLALELPCAHHVFVPSVQSQEIFPDAIPRLEISFNQSYHCENKLHQKNSITHLHFESVAQVLTDSTVLVSFHFPVALYFLECQVSIREKMMPNSLNCREE